MKERSQGNQPLRAAAAVSAAVVICAVSGYILHNTIFADTTAIESRVAAAGVFLPGSKNAQAGIDFTGDEYYVSTEVSFSEIDLSAARQELKSSAARGAAIETVSGGTLTQTPVYDSESTEGEVVCYLAPGTALTAPRQEEGKDWYEVYYGGACGYVPASSVRLDLDGEELAQLQETTAETYENSFGTLTAEGSIYAQESAEGEVLLTLTEGETLQLVSGANGWYSVIYQGTQGYVPGDSVAFGADKPAWKVEEEKEVLRAQVVETAKSYLNCPYVYAASGPSSFDCSGFTMFIMNQFGVRLPHSAAQQITTCGTEVSREELKPGDLVFFRAGSAAASHVGIYIGDGQFIHASSGAGYVTITDLTEIWYTDTYAGARRVL